MSSPTTPVTEDAHARADQLLARAADDYAAAQSRRARQSRQDRVHGNSTGDAR
jgi:hypothetical protein